MCFKTLTFPLVLFYFFNKVNAVNADEALFYEVHTLTGHFSFLLQFSNNV